MTARRPSPKSRNAAVSTAETSATRALVGAEHPLAHLESDTPLVLERELAAQLELRNISDLLGAQSIESVLFRLEPTQKGYAMLDAALIGGETFASRLASVSPSMRRARMWLFLGMGPFGIKLVQGRFGHEKSIDAEPHLALKRLFEHYQSPGFDFDEFDWSGAVDVLHFDPLSPVLERRTAVLRALHQLEAGKWYRPSTLLEAAKVEPQPFRLLANKSRTLEAAAVARLELAYVCAQLALFLGTMGVVDLAISSPALAKAALLGGQKRTLLAESVSSFRLTPLGRCLLGIDKTPYQAPRLETPKPLRVLTNAQVYSNEDPMRPMFRAFLSDFGKVLSPRHVQLEPGMLSHSANRFGSLDGLRQFLSKWASEALPSLVEEAFERAEQTGKALRFEGSYYRFDAIDEEIAERCCSDSKLRALCQRIGATIFLVRSSDYKSFERRIQELHFYVERNKMA